MDPKFRRIFPSFVCLFLVFSLFLTGCGRERLIPVPDGTIGEFYSSDGRKPPVRTGNPQNQAALREQERFDEFCMDVFCEELSSVSTLDLHYTVLHPENYGIPTGDVSLGTYSLSDMIKTQADIKKLKQRLLQFKPDSLTYEQHILYDTLAETLDTSFMSEGMELYRQPLSPTIGIQAQLPVLLAEYSFHSLEDVENYLTLLSQVDGYYDQILTFEKQKADSGLAPSDNSIDGIIKSCESYLVDPEDNFLSETFEARLSALKKTTPLTEEQKAELRARHILAVREHFIPAYKNLIDGMTALKGRGLSDGGLCSFKEGKRYYEYLLKAGPGLSYTVPELKRALTARMEADLSAISQLHKTHPDLDARTGTFKLTDPRKILNDLQVQMQGEFPPISSKGYEIRYVPEYLEDTLSPAFYLTAPIDAPDQNIIYINNGSPDSKENLYTTLAHEGFPGHLYQTVYSRNHAKSPLSALLSTSGANEGWATYVENRSCLFENGLPDGAGAYRAHLRSFSLCVHSLLDIGINYDGWTKEQAKKFILTYFQVDDKTVNDLWQVMIDNPANYLEYAGGYTELMEMETEAKEALGQKFSPLKFHKLILDMGPVPFAVMRKYFSIWLTLEGA